LINRDPLWLANRIPFPIDQWELRLINRKAD
jgi:hypothetical protein